MKYTLAALLLLVPSAVWAHTMQLKDGYSFEVISFTEQGGNIAYVQQVGDHLINGQAYKGDILQILQDDGTVITFDEFASQPAEEAQTPEPEPANRRKNVIMFTDQNGSDTVLTVPTFKPAPGETATPPAKTPRPGWESTWDKPAAGATVEPAPDQGAQQEAQQREAIEAQRAELQAQREQLIFKRNRAGSRDDKVRINHQIEDIDKQLQELH